MPYEPPKYPGAIPTAEDLPDRDDDVDWMYAARYNELKKELRAALIELGVDPAGAFDTVVARLDAAAIGDKISEGDTSVETIDTDADGHVDIKTENVLCGKFHSDGISDLPKQSRARGYRVAATQTIHSVTHTKVELDGENYDNQNEFDPTSNYRFTAKKAGYYQVNAAVNWSPVTADKRYLCSIYKNGGVVSRTYNHAGIAAAFSIQVSDVIYLAANDYVELWVYQDTGVDRNVFPYSELTYMSIHKLS